MDIGNNAFSRIYEQYKSGALGWGAKEHLRSDLAGTKIYTHSAFSLSGIGEKAARGRGAKWAAGANFVREAINRQYGPGVGEQVFRKIQENTGRNLNAELFRGDLETIKNTVGEVVAGRKQLEGTTSPTFTTAIETSINDKFGIRGDLSEPKKFHDGIHETFIADSNRATYQLNGRLLPKDREGVIEAFRNELTAGELRAVTGILHQGAPLAFIEQLSFSDDGPVKGMLGMPPKMEDRSGELDSLGNTSILSLERGKDGVLKVTIESRAPLQSSGLFGEDGMPQITMLDPLQSSLYTKISGEIRPGEDPIFRITQPIEYSLKLAPA